MSVREAWKSLVDSVTGRGVREIVERMAQVHGEVLLGMERRLDGFDRKAELIDKRLAEVGLAERVEGLTALGRRIRRLEVAVIVLALACAGLGVALWMLR